MLEIEVEFLAQTEDAVLVGYDGTADWWSKERLECSLEWRSLRPGQRIEVRLPLWWAEQRRLL